MYYRDKSVYEGEWYGDKRNGQGMLRLGGLIGSKCRGHVIGC